MTQAITMPTTVIRRPLFKRYRLANRVLLPIIGFVLFLCCWQVGHWLIGKTLPPPVDVAAIAIANLLSSPYLVGLGMPEGGLWPNLVSTAGTVLVGLISGGLLGVALGGLTARSPLLEEILNPIVTVLGAVPILVAAPFFLIWFGLASSAKIALVALYSGAILHVYTFRGIQNVRPHFAEYARTLGGTDRATFFFVMLPASLPEIFGGIRVALGSAWGLAAITELLGSQSGIGRVIISAWGVSDIALMLAGLLWLCGIALGVDAILMGVRRYVLRWV
ncbi:ABC transporter permease [Microvirga sp. G4-2]|uniref:ABC transporter permease n=1 Tax=Microvirga sp. G4-2 TaxID=3434467 RepID=UPI004044568E